MWQTTESKGPGLACRGAVARDVHGLSPQATFRTGTNPGESLLHFTGSHFRRLGLGLGRADGRRLAGRRRDRQAAPAKAGGAAAGEGQEPGGCEGNEGGSEDENAEGGMDADGSPADPGEPDEESHREGEDERREKDSPVFHGIRLGAELFWGAQQKSMTRLVYEWVTGGPGVAGGQLRSGQPGSGQLKSGRQLLKGVWLRDEA